MMSLKLTELIYEYDENHSEDAISQFLKSKTIHKKDRSDYVFVESNGGVETIICEYRIEAKKFVFVANSQYDIRIKKGMEFSNSFMLLVLRFDGHGERLNNYLYQYFEQPIPYIRVGVDYFHKIDRNIDGINRSELVSWKKEILVSDFGKDVMKLIPIYKCFGIFPNNISYQESIDGIYNKYSPFIHTPRFCESEEQVKWSLILMRHVFGEQINLGLKYMRVLYENPTQILPILVLLSSERQTGKTTFINWLNVIFGANMIIIDPQAISSSFNGSYADKNIIAIEESKFDSTQALEKLKSLATARTLSVNPKFQQPYTLPFYGKLIITSNDEKKFSKVDWEEIRYWARKVPTIEIGNHNILDDLTNEVPYFLDYLTSWVEAIDYKNLSSRQVFTAEEIQTEALIKVKDESRSGLFKELNLFFEDWMLQNYEVEYLHFIPKNIKEKWFDRNNNIGQDYILSVLENEFKLKRTETPRRFTPFTEHNFAGASTSTGRYFTLKNIYYGKSIEEAESEYSARHSNDEAPF